MIYVCFCYRSVSCAPHWYNIYYLYDCICICVLWCLVMHYAKLNTGLEYSFMFDIANVDCNLYFFNILYYYLLLN